MEIMIGTTNPEISYQLRDILSVVDIKVKVNVRTRLLSVGSILYFKLKLIDEMQICSQEL
jgi:hypothetical protein